MSNDFFMRDGMPGELNLYNKGFRLEIGHLPTNLKVAFPAFIEQFSDAYNSEWSESTPYGRMDPIGTFAGTRRAISVAWKIPATSAVTAKLNLDKVNKLVSFLYPSYSRQGVSQASTINVGPYWEVKFGNLICNSLTGGPLLGWVNGITVDPLFEDGCYMYDRGNHNFRSGSPSDVGIAVYDRTNTAPGGGAVDPDMDGIKYFPQTIRLNFEMTVVHEHSLGWIKGSNGEYVFRGRHEGSIDGGSFPYPSSRKLSHNIDETDTSLAQTREAQAERAEIRSLAEAMQAQEDFQRFLDPESHSHHAGRSILQPMGDGDPI